MNESKMEHYWSQTWFQYVALSTLAFIWGSSFILMKIGLKSFSSEQAAGIRMALASLILLPYAFKNAHAIQRKDIKSLLIAGFLGGFIPAFLFTVAQKKIDSALAGMLNSLTPFFTLLLGFLVYKSTFRRVQVIGLLLGLTGAAGLILFGGGASFTRIHPYAFFIVLATVLYAININEVRSRLAHLSGVQVTSISLAMTLPFSIGYLLITDFTPVLSIPSWPWHLVALGFLGVLGTAIGMLLLNSIIQNTSAVFASMVAYIIPIFAMGWGILDGEHIGFTHVVCMGCILLGVYLTNARK